MEVGYHEISVVQVDIQGRISEEDTGKTTADEETNETDSKTTRSKRISPRWWLTS